MDTPTTRFLIALYRMARPLIMVSVVLVYLLGILIARSRGYTVDLSTIALGSIPLLIVMASIHYVNEFADVETDRFTTRTQFSGGSGAIPDGLVSPRAAVIAAWVTLIFGIVLTLLLIALDRLSAVNLLILGLGTFFGWMYSVPPLKLAWRGLGEIDNAILGGLLLPAYGYVVVARRVDLVILVALIPFTLATFLNLLATTWADRDADTQAGKYTLATLWPIPLLRILYAVVAISAIALLVLLPRTLLPESVAALSLIVLIPMWIWGWTRYTRTQSPAASVLSMVGLLLAQLIGYAMSG